MTITYFSFQPDLQSAVPWTAQITLDGQPYVLQASWAIWGQRWYFSLTSAAGSLVVYEPIIESTDVSVGSLTTTYQARIATLANLSGPLYQNWLASSVNLPSGTYIVSPIIPNLGAAGTATIHLSQPASATGTDSAAMFSYDINLIAGYGFTSSLVYRSSSAQFEVNDSPPVIVAPVVA